MFGQYIINKMKYFHINPLLFGYTIFPLISQYGGALPKILWAIGGLSHKHVPLTQLQLTQVGQ